MARDLAALLETQPDVRETSASTTIVPRGIGVQEAIGLLEQMAGAPLLASVQLKTGNVIGRGGMGIVREAQQVALARTVAVKTVKDDKRSPEAAQDLLREAWITGSLEHPNVVPVHHLGLDEHGMPAIVLKRVEGVEWSKLIRDADEVKRRYGATDLLAWNLSILMQVLNAIRFAHSRGILHRDLKPANVMIGDFGEVYLLDWGVAVSTRDDGTGRLPLAKDAQHVAGTPCYMAPEMLAPDGEVPLSERTDVYLAGAVLFEIVAGRPPHEGKTAIEVMTSVLTSKPVVPDSVPGELATICARAMAYDPEDRFESAEAIRLALQSYLEHRGSDQLVQRTKLRLDELAALLASPPTDRARHREDVYRLFGACRFGFHEALAAWKDNAAARTGLRRATTAVAEYELATGDPRSAVTLLSELDEPPALLERAREAAAKFADRQRALEELDHAHDLAVGRRERGKLTTTIGVAFVIVPFAMHFASGQRFESHALHIAWSLLFALIVLVWTWFGRSRLTTTLVNRRLMFTFVFMFVAQALMLGCLWHRGVDIAHSHLMMLFLYFVTAGIVATTVDKSLAATAIVYGIALVVASVFLEYRYLALAGGNAVFTLNAFISWHQRGSSAPTT